MKDTLIFEGEIVEVLPNTKFKVKLENGQIVECYLGGKLKMNKISIMMNDKVSVELSPYDVTKGRITWIK